MNFRSSCNCQKRGKKTLEESILNQHNTSLSKTLLKFRNKKEPVDDTQNATRTSFHSDFCRDSHHICSCNRRFDFIFQFMFGFQPPPNDETLACMEGWRRALPSQDPVPRVRLLQRALHLHNVIGGSRGLSGGSPLSRLSPPGSKQGRSRELHRPRAAG